MNLEQNELILILQTAAAVVVVLVFPLLLFIAKNLKQQLEELKAWNLNQDKKLAELERGKIGRVECREHYEPLQTALTNGLRGDVSKLCERVAVLEAKGT